MTISRSPVLFIVLGGAALIFGVANVVGSQGFPYNAPVEQVIAFGVTIDSIAVLLVAVIGVIVARQPFVLKPVSVLAVIGMSLTAIVLAIVLFTWVMGLAGVASGTRLHYSDQTWLTFLFAPVWLTGLTFSGFSFRRGGARRNNLVSMLGVAFGIAILALAALSAVLYGLGLTT